jgi:hypothetical protein
MISCFKSPSGDVEISAVDANYRQCCGSESGSGSESERIRAFLAETESEIFVPDSDSVPDPVI